MAAKTLVPALVLSAGRVSAAQSSFLSPEIVVRRCQVRECALSFNFVIVWVLLKLLEIGHKEAEEG